jgi:hypothetical protein
VSLRPPEIRAKSGLKLGKLLQVSGRDSWMILELAALIVRGEM